MIIYVCTLLHFLFDVSICNGPFHTLDVCVYRNREHNGKVIRNS